MSEERAELSISLDDYDYPLPAELIAQHPAQQRSASRLLVLDRSAPGLEHRTFSDLPHYLRAGDVLVLNETRVLPARLRAKKESGGKVEVLLLEPVELEGEQAWQVLLKPGKAFAEGRTLQLEKDPETGIRCLARKGQTFIVSFSRAGEELDPAELRSLAEKIGEIPLPPYISREPQERESPHDSERYQTVYARVPGSSAAPTAGLHLDPGALRQLESAGVEILRLTLHIGLDTFKPLSQEAIDSGTLHGERVELPSQTAAKLLEARRENRRIIAVGTTTVRALESFADSGFEAPFNQRTHLFIRPPWEFRLVDGLITNFHLPRSSLLMLVSSLTGRERLLATYKEAVEQEYRFFSYGDAMLIL
ncbi:MAG: tRNA preQ1(34) S-adenosylmethionine ribosyltransferase-isomerase QueA [Planctomycetota bacterium]|nr:tRNA preQ1(34) S-adenosylmethionine ribosyltransferase-isomerase QueA [Planctomycetota bacterium]